ncbi:MAG: DegV family protein [Candidatus Limnocylindrales bacterium]
MTERAATETVSVAPDRGKAAPRVAIVTDSASDIPPDEAAEHGIGVAPLLVIFGPTEYRTGVDISAEQFWTMMLAPGAPFPRTAACSPAEFTHAYDGAFDAGAEAVVCVTVGGKLSATLKSARVARDGMPKREIHVIDSESASYGFGIPVLMAAEMAAAGAGAAEIATTVEARLKDMRFYVVLETLEYLRRGGRISGVKAAIGGVLSTKPIITIADGLVETVDRPRTRGKARERLFALLAAEPVERAVVIHGMAPDIEGFADELATVTGLDREDVAIRLIGPSIGPHVGPGAYGAVVLRKG